MKSFLSRCLLFTPANRPERFPKAKELGADGLIIDLEDAISLPEKDSAREQAIKYFISRPRSDGFVECLRINSIRTRAGLKDITKLCECAVQPAMWPDILVLPKSQSANEIDILNELLGPNTVPLLPLIETAKGLEHAYEIARATNVIGLIFGGADFAADIGATMDWEPMYSARAQLVQAAAQAGIAAIDVPYLHLKDPDDSKVLDETRRVKAMGYTCKLSIHPKHIKPIMDTLSPSPEEMEKAKAVVSAYEAAKGNACELNGKMIDVPVYRSAKRVLALASLGGNK